MMMKLPGRLLILIILVSLSKLSFGAPDLNGYTSEYECKLDGQHCDVDIQNYINAACTTTVNTGDSNWPTLGSTDKVVCVKPGDHTSKGTFTISTNGTSNERRIVKFYDTGDDGKDPWDQTTAAKAKRIAVEGDYWIIHRLEIDPNNDEGIDSSGDHLIMSKLWIHDGNGSGLVSVGGASYNTLQNSLIHDTGWTDDSDHHCIFAKGSSFNFSVVNNEIYNCSGDGLQKSPASTAAENLVIENNDIYITPDLYTDGNGNTVAEGSELEACAENALDFKEGGRSSANAIKVLHNRIWGFRRTETNGTGNNCSCCDTGSSGEHIILNDDDDGTGTDYGVIYNNILFDGVSGITNANGIADNWSIVGNIFYDFFGHHVSTGKRVVQTEASDNYEIYLNSFIDVDKDTSEGWVQHSSNHNHDTRCNTVIDGGTSQNLIASSNQANHQVYYDSTASSEASKINKSISTRSSSTSYDPGDVVKWGSISNCNNTNDPECFLYRADHTGTQTSDSGTPSPCVEMGCTFMDNEVQWRAIRGPYTFYRKLLTTPESYIIPYARPYRDKTDPLKNEASIEFCPGNYNSRDGIGIDND